MAYREEEKRVENFEGVYAFVMKHVAWAAAKGFQIVVTYNSDGSYSVRLRAGGHEYMFARIADTEIMCRYDTAPGETVEATYHK